jgi:hypothetical protein
MQRRWVVPIAVVFLALAVAAVAAASSKPFKLGLYEGKTSQGQPVRLKVVPCGSHQCVEAQESLETSIEMPCPSIKETSAESFFPAFNAISAKGKVSANQEGFGKVVATLQVTHNGVITGKIRATETLEDGAKCDSGPVTLRAKLK